MILCQLGLSGQPGKGTQLVCRMSFQIPLTTAQIVLCTKSVFLYFFSINVQLLQHSLKRQRYKWRRPTATGFLPLKTQPTK